MFIDFILDLHNNGLSNRSYKLRAKVLSEILCPKLSTLSTELHVIKCQREIGWMARKIFKTMPSIIEESNCSVCPYNKTNKLTGLQICDKSLLETSKEDFIDRLCMAPSSVCPKCSEDMNTRIIEIGNLTSISRCKSVQLSLNFFDFRCFSLNFFVEFVALFGTHERRADAQAAISK